LSKNPHQNHRFSVRPSGRRERRVSDHRECNQCGRHGVLRHDHNWVHVGDRVAHARRNPPWCIHPNGHRADDVDDRHARNPSDPHGVLRHGRNLVHEYGDVRASRKNYGIHRVIQGERCRAILASESFPRHCVATVLEQMQFDSEL
jgi:hypothetical protein